MGRISELYKAKGLSTPSANGTSAGNSTLVKDTGAPTELPVITALPTLPSGLTSAQKLQTVQQALTGELPVVTQGKQTLGQIAERIQNAETPSEDFSGGRTSAGGGRGEQFSLPKLVGGTLLKGADEFVSGLTSTAAWLENATLGTLFPGTTENSPIQALNDLVQSDKAYNQNRFAGNVAAGGKAAEIVDKYGTATAAAVPQAALALMTAGASTAAQGTTAGLEATASAAQVGAGILNSLKSSVSAMSKDPQYWLAFSQVAGNSYDQAIADGADETKANLYALGNGLMNAAVEVGGGIQKLPGELQQGSTWFKTWLDSMLDEGKEEVVQGVLERGFQNLIYQKENPLFSVSDENAVLNPKTAAEEFAGGAVVGGILGGAQTALGSALNNGIFLPGSGLDTPVTPSGTPVTGQNTVQADVGTNAQENVSEGVQGQNKTASTGETESTTINTDPAQHTAVEQAVIEAYQAAVDENLVNFVETALENKGSNKGRYALKPVSERATADIKALTGVDTSGFKTVLEQRIAEHIVDRHGANGAADNSMQDINDIARMQYVLDNYDSMEPAGKSTAYTTVKGNGKTGLADTVKYVKAVNGTYYVVEAVPDTRKKTAFIVSAYMTKNTAENQQPGNASFRKPPADNARGADAENSAVDPTVPQTAQGVKNQSAQAGAESSNNDTVDGFGQNTVGAAEAQTGAAIKLDANGNPIGPESSVGAATHGFDPYSNMISEYGVIPEGENPARIVDVPKSTNGKDKVSYTARTVMEAKATPDSMLGEIGDAILSGELSHEVVTDKAAMAHARSIVEDKGWEGAKEVFHQAAKKGTVSKDSAALGQVLLNNAMNAGDAKAVIDILTDYASMSTTAAQSLQAQRMLKKLTPEGQLYGIQRSVSNMQEELAKKYGDKAPDLEIPDELVQNFLDAQDQAGRDAAIEEIYKSVAAQTPATWLDKWNAWRYMAMLTNPRTHVRNIAGNVGFAPVRLVKDALATAMEAGVDYLSPNGIERTKAALNPASSADRALVKAAFADVENVQDQLLGNGKYVDNATGKIEEYRTIFKFKPLEAVRKANSGAMDIEDTWFSKPAYAGALAGYLKINGVTAQALEDGSVDAKTLDAARSYAIREAQRATYRDANAFSDFVSKLHYRGTNPVGQAANVLVEGVLPFRRTPANILVRGVEYSPAGLVKGLTYDLAQVHSGNMTAAQAIDDIAAGLTGTGLLALGVWLASMGLISGGSSGDDDQDAQDDLTGGQNYALSICGKNFTLDWLAPEALPFFVGVEAYNTWSDKSDGGFQFKDALSAMERITDPMLEMSMLQGVQDMIDNVRYADGGTLFKVMANAAISYLTQAVPTLFGQIERTVENQRYSTYVDSTSGMPSDLQYTIGRVMNKLPGEYHQIPYIDAWGRTEEAESLPGRAFNNFLNPSYVSTEQVTDADKELQRLYDAGQAGVFPDRVSQSVQVTYKENPDDEESQKRYLTADEYVEYSTIKGQTSYDIVCAMIDSDFYKSLTDEQKADAVKLAYTYAGHLAAEEVTDGKHESERYVELAQAAKKELGLSEAEYLLLYKEYGGTAVNGDKVREAYRAGMDPVDYLEYNAGKKSYDADGSGGLTIEENAEAIQNSGLSKSQQEIMWLLTYPDWAEAAEKKGVSISDYIQYKVATYGCTKDADKRAALVTAGFSMAEARTLVNKIG